MRIPFSIILISIALLSFQKKNVEVLFFEKYECELDSDNSYSIRNRIIEQALKDDTLDLKIGFWATCCDQFSASADITNSILKLNVKKTGNLFECFCFHYFKFRIKLNGEKYNAVVMNGKTIEFSTERYETFPVEYSILNGDTINRKDKYGVRQGKWIDPTRGDSKQKYVVYKNGIVNKLVQLYSDGNIKSEKIREKLPRQFEGKQYLVYDNYNLYREYYPNGDKRKECRIDVCCDNYELGLCKEWDELGSLIYEGKFKQ